MSQRLYRALKVEVVKFVMLDGGWSNCCNLMEGRYISQYEGGKFVVFCVADVQKESADICIDSLGWLKDVRIGDDALADGKPAEIR